MNYQHHEETVEKIIRCESLDDLHKLCSAIAAQSGFDFYTIKHVNFPSLVKPEAILFSNFPEKWLQHYYNQKFYKIDPIINTSFSQPTPVVWHDVFNKYPGCIHILNESGEMGVRVGVSSAINMPGTFTFISFASPRMETCDLQKGAFIINAYIGYIHEKLLDLSKTKSTLAFALTPRQVDVVLWLAEGKDVSSIAAILGCTERTVSAHIQAIKKNTNSLNITHAVAKVLLNQDEYSRIIEVAGESKSCRVYQDICSNNSA